MDRCDIERNPISLAAVRALGEAHLKCCMQMYYALALIKKGNAPIAGRKEPKFESVLVEAL